MAVSWPTAGQRGTARRAYGVSRATVYNAGTWAVAELWTEADVIAVDHLYRERGRLDAKNGKVQALARELGRIPTAVAAC
jgi:hypothetical protein